VGQRFNPDVIHASIGFPGAIWGWILSRLLGKPFVFTEHTRVNNNFRSFFHRVTTKFGISKARILMAVSQPLARELKTISLREVKVVPNIIDVRRFSGEKKKSPDTPVVDIGFLGGMNTPVKGLDILLNAVAGVHQPFRLHIGGTGKLEHEYRALAKELSLEEKCIFYGFINPDQVPGFMEKIDFLVCSSRYETFCVALVEAMASGLPVVSTRCGGPEDFVTEENGILCNREDVNALRNAINAMANAYGQFDAVRIRNFVMNNFTSEIYRRKMDDVLSQAITR
jgi:glycosyltransferase involved in cell wall biosynthesis